MRGVSDGLASETGGEMLEDGLGVVVDVEHGVQLCHLLGMACVFAEAVDGDVDVLEAKRNGDDEEGEKLACTAGGEPAIHPCEDHAGEEHVGNREGEGCCIGDGCKLRAGNGDAGGGREQGNCADDSGGAEKAEEEADKEIARKAKREADQGFWIERQAGGGDVDADDDLEEEDAREDSREVA